MLGITHNWYSSRLLGQLGDLRSDYKGATFVLDGTLDIMDYLKTIEQHGMTE